MPTGVALLFSGEFIENKAADSSSLNRKRDEESGVHGFAEINRNVFYRATKLEIELSKF